MNEGNAYTAWHEEVRRGGEQLAAVIDASRNSRRQLAGKLETDLAAMLNARPTDTEEES